MRAVVLRSFRHTLEVVEDHPEPVPDGEVIDVTACGVCHSDLHVVDGDIRSPLPLILGHEVTGVHAQLGPVMVYAPWGCRDCELCREGVEMLCLDVAEAGIFSDGGYAQRMRVRDASYLVPLGDLDPVACAPFACGGVTAYRAVTQGLETLRRAGRRRRSLVIGAGGLGQYAIRFLRLMTEAEVNVVDKSPQKRATALERGADAAFTPGDDLPPSDFVADFVGSEATLATAAAAVVPRGLVAVVGLRRGRIPFGFGAVSHEARFMSSIWGSRSQLEELLALATREPSAVNPVETLPLSEAQTAHNRLRSGQAKSRMVLTTP